MISYAHERADIDRKIFDLKAQLQDLYQQRNTMIPVGRMHPELLGEVFSYLQREWSSWEKGKVPFLVKLTHVSHSWRTTTLNTPALWNEIFFQNQILVAEWLKRSGNANLYVSLETKDGDRVLPQIFGQLHRVRHLQVKVTSGRLPQFPAIPAPVLSVLSISCGALYSLPFPLLFQNLPAICELHITNGRDINLPAAMPRTLTSLRILKSSISITIPALLGLLERLPQLKSIALESVTLSTSRRLAADLPSIKLGRLETFEFHGTEGNLDFLFLSQIRFSQSRPPKVTFSSSFPGHQVHPHDRSTMLSAIKKLWTRTTNLHELRLDFIGSSLRLETALTVIAITNPAASAGINSEYLTWMQDNISLFMGLQDLSVSGTIPTAFWLILPRLTTLQSLKISTHQSHEFFRILIEAFRSRNISIQRSSSLLPKLRTLTVEHADFSRVQAVAVIDALKDRCNTRKKLAYMGLENCSGLGGDLVSRLQSVVDKLDCKWGQRYSHLDFNHTHSDGDDDDEEDENSELDEQENEVVRCEYCRADITCRECVRGYMR